MLATFSAVGKELEMMSSGTEAISALLLARDALSR
jgi:hypothetical protein